MTLKEAMQILLDVSWCSDCGYSDDKILACEYCERPQHHYLKVEEARRIVELYLTPAEPTMEK